MAETTDSLELLRYAATVERRDASERDGRRHELILHALHEGHTRAEIAAALGITRQALSAYLKRRDHA